jgi:hypothetical protein
LFHSYAVGDLPLDCCWRGRYDGRTWQPLVDVTVRNGAYESRRIRGLLDSGSAITLFDTSICDSLDINLNSCPRGVVGGIGDAKALDVFYHDVHLKVSGQAVKTLVGFAKDLPVSALLGRHGFFEHFVVTFHPGRAGVVLERA